MIYLLLALFSCAPDNMLSSHSVEEKYIYPSYYDVFVETDTAVVEVEVPSEDTGETLPIWIDSFEQPNATAGVDVIWVIDPSGSMNIHRTRLLAGISDMMSAMPAVSWRLTIISADPRIALNDSDFPLLPGDGAAEAHAEYSSSVTGGMEQGFEAAYEYIENNPMAGSWMRDDASLLVVFVSDEEEQSNAAFPTVSDFTDWLDEQTHHNKETQFDSEIQPNDDLRKKVDDFIDYVKREIQEMKDEITNLKKSDSKNSLENTTTQKMKNIMSQLQSLPTLENNEVSEVSEVSEFSEHI